MELIGRENLEIKAPIIFVSNHPNSFLDPLVFLINLDPNLSFIAGAEWFGKGFKNWVFREEFNMIPVIRPHLKKGGKISNDEMFIHCYERLAEDGRIIIYPEGTSVTVTKIRELKTGAARIKIGADKFLKGEKEVLIIPVGLNYSNPRRFQSDVIVNVGPPIDFTDLDTSKDKDLAHSMTERIREKMAELVLHYEDVDFTPFARKVSRVYAETIRQSLDIEEDQTHRIFRIQQDILKAIIHFQKSDPEGFTQIKDQIDQFFDELDQYGLDPRFLPGSASFPFRQFFKISLLAPLFSIGFVCNALPFITTRWIFNSKIKPNISEEYEPGKLNPAFIASLTYLVGMIIFLIWYVAVGIFVGIMTESIWVVIGTVLGGYIFGRIATYFSGINYRLSRTLRTRKMYHKQPELMREILKKRKTILDKLNIYYGKYQKLRESVTNEN
jgi:1-acyl-sn-glycerol-3-phosphate acyltransferase